MKDEIAISKGCMVVCLPVCLFFFVVLIGANNELKSNFSSVTMPLNYSLPKMHNFAEYISMGN